MAKFENRISYIGGSDFSTVLDINPFRKRIELVLEKAGVIVNNFEGNEATRRGELLEDIVIEMFEEKTGLKVTDKQAEFEMKIEDCIDLKCHLDGITSDNAVFEAKTTDVKSKTWKDGIPLYYKAQLEFNCKLSKKEKAYIAVAFCDENEIVKFEHFEYIPTISDEEFETTCKIFTKDVEKYKSFGIVNNGILVKEKEDLNKLIEDLEEIDAKISNIKKEIKPLEEEKKKIESILKSKIGNNLGIETNLYKVTMSNRITSPVLDYKISRSGLKIEYKE